MANSRICSIPDCGKRHRARGFCAAHYERWNHHGDPLGGGTPKGATTNFIRDVVLPYEGDECLIWPYATTVEGYGLLTIGGIHKLAHRLVCEKVNGPPPTPNHDTAHSCGRGDYGCVTKRHLSWKTRAANMADKLIHGTHHRGERHSCAKLTEDGVREIRSLRGKVMQAILAEQFSVSRSLISQIQTGKCWNWMD